MKIDSLWCYPVKSCAGFSTSQLSIIKGGARWDRMWMIVDEKGQFLTQRQKPKMASIKTSLSETSLILTIDNYVFEVPFEDPDLKITEVQVWKSKVGALMEDELINRQLSEFLGQNVRLVRSLEGQRQFDIRFQDSRPLQVANLASLKALNHELSKPITIERFRANIVVSGAKAFEEDSWTQVELGGLQFEVSKPCIRCNIINVDPETGTRTDNEPLVKLKEFHSIESQPAFGVLVIPKILGLLKK